MGAWGVKGGIRVKAFSSDPQALFATKRWFLQAPAGVGGVGRRASVGAQVWPRLLRIVQAREQGDHVVATAQDLDDRDAAEALGGARIFISRSSFPTPDDGEFYWVDLIGLAVRNRDGRELGTVVGLLETGPTCVLRILPPAVGAEKPDECLIPFVSAYVDRVDLPGRCVHVDWLPDY
jgi:16S rRNA processing protein RimM